MSDDTGNWRPREDRDVHAAALRRQFARASSPYFRRRAVRNFLRRPPISIVLFVAAFTLTVAGFVASPWPPGETLRHIAAAPDCNAARAMTLAPARRGEPGYYERHDADNDGVACEPYQP